MVHTESDIEYEKTIARTILASRQTATKGEAGKTGEWRTMRPVLHPEHCLVVKLNQPSCHLCWLYCPDNTVSRTIPPEFDYDYCKGCGICAHECPAHAIWMVPEKEQPSCTQEELIDLKP
jgi:pyruvate ferredoxin oxidoreductase delta subunit